MASLKNFFTVFAIAATITIVSATGSQHALAAATKKGPGIQARICQKLLGAPANQYIKYTKELEFSAEQEQEFAEIFEAADKTDSEKLGEYYQRFTEYRQGQLPKASQFLLKRVTKDAREQKSIYARTLGKLLSRFAGPHYNIVLNRTGIKSYGREHLNDENHILDLDTYVHELEHAAERNSSPLWILYAKIFVVELNSVLVKTPFSPLTRFRSESRAMGAEWEFVRRIPQETRDRLIEQLKLTLLAWGGGDLWGYDHALTNIEAREDLRIPEALEKIKKNIRIENNIYKNVARAIRFDEVPESFSPTGLDIIFNTKHYQARFHFTESFINRLKALREMHESFKEDQKKRKLSAGRRWAEEGMLVDLLKMQLDVLEQANLSKEEFIDMQAPRRQYTVDKLIESHYKGGFYRTWITFMTGLQLLLWHYGGHHGVEKLTLVATDLNLLYQLAEFIARP